MKLLTFLAGLALTMAACNETPSSVTNDYFKWTPDVKSENLKGDVAQLETTTYYADSTSGQRGDMESKTVEKYNEGGYAVSYSEFLAEDSSTTLTVYTVDAHNYLIGSAVSRNGKPVSSIEYLVDSTGKVVLATSFDSADKAEAFYKEIKMNEYGQVISGSVYNTDSSLKSSFTNNFDSIYYTGGESKDSVGALTYAASITLDEKRNPLKMEETSVEKDSSVKTVTTYVYDKWDDKGNWLQKTVIVNGKPSRIVIRSFTYRF